MVISVRCQEESIDALRFLIENDADITALNFEQMNALDIALFYNRSETAKYLISQNVNLCHNINKNISTYDIAKYNDLTDILSCTKQNNIDKSRKYQRHLKKYFKFAEKNIQAEIFENKLPDDSYNMGDGVNFKKNKNDKN